MDETNWKYFTNLYHFIQLSCFNNVNNIEYWTTIYLKTKFLKNLINRKLLLLTSIKMRVFSCNDVVVMKDCIN